MSLFKKAKRSQAKLRLGLIGPSGSGKTMTGLRVANGLAGEGGKIAFIDSEHCSGELYSDLVDFDVLNLDSFEVERYIEAIQDACENGYDVIVIDSLSHAWSGKGGILEFVDKAGKRGGNNFSAWRDATPRHNRLIEAILSASAHVICTLRSKVEHVIEKDSAGRTTVRKVGLQPVQREGMEYEFTIVGDINDQHELIITKTRAAFLKDEIIREAGEDFGRRLRDWLNEGEPQPARIQPKPPAAELVMQTVDRIGATNSADSLERLREKISARAMAGEITDDQKKTLLTALESRLAQLGAVA